jgi:hypothetical protein
MATGTLRKFVAKGISFDVAADADLEETITQFENTLIVTTGKSVIKQEKRAQQVGGLVLITSGADAEILRDIADSGQEISMSYTKRSGDTYRLTGTFNVENNTTMESRTSLILLPTSEVTAVIA